MAERKTTLKLLGNEVPATEVPILQRTEIPGEYTLEDGSVIRFAAPVTVVYRIDGQFDADGSPFYFVKHGAAVTVVRAGEQTIRK